MFAKEAVETIHKSHLKSLERMNISTTCTNKITNPYTTHIGAAIKSVKLAREANKETTMYKYTEDISSTPAIFPSGVNAQIRPKIVTSTVVTVPAPNISKPALTKPVLRIPPAHCVKEETAKLKPIKNNQSVAVARFFSPATSAFAAAATASNLDVSALQTLFHFGANLTASNNKAIHTE